MTGLYLAALIIGFLVVMAVPTKESKTMSKFDHLKKLEVDPTKTAELTLVEIKGHPVLTLVCAGEENRGLSNAVLAIDGAKSSSRRRSRVTTVDDLGESRDSERSLYARYVCKGWVSMLDDEGNDVPFNDENCKDFFDSIPPRIFDDVRLFATNETNFTDEVIDVEGVSKNSQSG